MLSNLCPDVETQKKMFVVGFECGEYVWPYLRGRSCLKNNGTYMVTDSSVDFWYSGTLDVDVMTHEIS